MDFLLACATCANNFQDADTDAAGWAILFMLGVIVPMLGGVAWCMIRIARRERQLLDPDLQDDFDPDAAVPNR